jgi:hypothetical protein
VIINQINEFHGCDHTPIPPFSWIGFPLLLIFISARVVPKKISLETIVTCLNEPRRSRLRGSQDRKERSELQGISSGEIKRRNVLRGSDTVHRGDEQKVVIFVGNKKTGSNKKKNIFNVVRLHATTKMSSPYDLEVAFLAKQDMGMNPCLQGREGYAVL